MISLGELTDAHEFCARESNHCPCIANLHVTGTRSTLARPLSLARVSKCPIVEPTLSFPLLSLGKVVACFEGDSLPSRAPEGRIF
jgi:hypothetical protein